MANLQVYAQEEEVQEKKKERPARKAFQSAVLIDNQTDVINQSKTLEWNIQHRFGGIKNGASDLWGIFAPANTRLGFNYSLFDRLRVGFGLTKINVPNPYVDLNLKYKILQQTRSNSMPINLTYFGNTAIDTQNESNFDEGVHRLSYFHELIFSRRFGSKFSALVAGQFAHMNAVDTLYENDVYGVRFAAKYRITSQTSIMLEWTEPFVSHPVNDEVHGDLKKNAGPDRNIGIALEVATSSHAFQIFISYYRDLLPQYNLVYNTNEPGFQIGFNITRLWNF
jgi:hypothetical protein